MDFKDISNAVVEIGNKIDRFNKDNQLNSKSIGELFEQVNALQAGAGRIGFTGGSAPQSLQSQIGQELKAHSDEIAKFARKEIKEFSFELKTVADMTFGVNLANASASVASLGPGIVGAAQRPLHVRDLLPKSPMTGSNFVYLKETGVDGAPGATAEAGAKPQVDFILSEATSKAQVIAGWLQISNQMLEDVPSMTSFLQNRLLERLLVAEDTELLSGSGTDPHLLGLNTAGNFTAATGAATIDIEQLVQAIAQLAALSRTPSGIILSPADYFNLMLNKATGSGDYTVPPIVYIDNLGTLRINGVPAVWTAEQATGTFTVGDFANGTLLLSRLAPRIEFFVDSTLAKLNKTMVRIEERIALAVYGSTYIIKGSF